MAVSRQPLAQRGSAHRHENTSERLSGSGPASGPPEKSPSPHLAPLLRHSSARSGRGSTHHSDSVREPLNKSSVFPPIQVKCAELAEESGNHEAEEPGNEQRIRA